MCGRFLWSMCAGQGHTQQPPSVRAAGDVPVHPEHHRVHRPAGDRAAGRAGLRRLRPPEEQGDGSRIRCHAAREVHAGSGSAAGSGAGPREQCVSIGGHGAVLLPVPCHRRRQERSRGWEWEWGQAQRGADSWDIHCGVGR